MQSNNKKQQIIDKIIKLISLSESTPFGDEKESAISKIARLMTEYEISESEVDKQYTDFISKTKPTGKTRFNGLHSDLLVVIAKFCGVALYGVTSYQNNKREKSYRLVGRQVDVDYAEYLYEVLLRQIIYLKAEYKKRKLGMLKNNSYEFGLITTINNRLQEIVKEVLKYKEVEGLVPVYDGVRKTKEAMEYYESKNKVKTKHANVRVVEEDAFDKGCVDGESIEIKAPLQNSMLAIS